MIWLGLFVPIWVAIPAGTYTVGDEGFMKNPRRQVKLSAFEISTYEVTNREFREFIEATKYRTDAEKSKNAMVFRPPLPEFKWIKDPSATWRFPNGSTAGGIEKKLDHPVTTISYRDAQAYCKWRGVRLPKHDEWEVACRAGSMGKFFFGADVKAVKEYANVWHQTNHRTLDLTDGFAYTSPVGSFKPNALGLHDMYGNVFELVEGRVPTDKSQSQVHARGGSWWCSPTACCAFNSYEIGTVNKGASFSNQGFRVVRVKK